MGRKPCCNKEEVRRGAWTIEEDRLLEEYVGINGEGKWRSMPSKAGLRRCGKSCRLRWFNYLKPGIKRGNISVEEEDLIIELHNKFGNRWSVIAEGLPGRTDNEIKNYWNTSLKRKILKDGSKLEIRSKTRRLSTKKLAAMAEASDVRSQSCEEYQPHADSCSESATVSDDQKTSSSSSSASSFWKGLLQDLELEPVDPNPNPNPHQNNLDLVSGETSSGSNSKDSSDFDWNMDEIGNNSVGISPLSGGFGDEHDLFKWLEYLDVGSISSFLDTESEDMMGENTVT